MVYRLSEGMNSNTFHFKETVHHVRSFGKIREVKLPDYLLYLYAYINSESLFAPERRHQ